jgi:protein-L-isoaspartate(D-aspartate) O-methyltransferase
VPREYRALAFADLEIPLSTRARMWTPKMEGRVLQELELRSTERVLEIGTGSGYFTALLASQVAEVDSVEIDARLANEARSKLARHGFRNARVLEGDGARGYGNDAYDVIVLTGSTPLLPERFFEQLKPDGRLFAVVGEAPAMEARFVRQMEPGTRVSVDLFETVIAPLLNAATPARFQF